MVPSRETTSGAATITTYNGVSGGFRPTYTMPAVAERSSHPAANRIAIGRRPAQPEAPPRRHQHTPGSPTPPPRQRRTRDEEERGSSSHLSAKTVARSILPIPPSPGRNGPKRQIQRRSTIDRSPPPPRRPQPPPRAIPHQPLCCRWPAPTTAAIAVHAGHNSRRCLPTPAAPHTGACPHLAATGDLARATPNLWPDVSAAAESCRADKPPPEDQTPAHATSAEEKGESHAVAVPTSRARLRRSARAATRQERLREEGQWPGF